MFNKKITGVTLLEVLLVLAIASVVLLLFIGFMQQTTDELRRDRASVHLRQILNASQAYFVANNKWPDNIAQLRGSYLPANSVPLRNPWGNPYEVAYYSGPDTKSTIYVFTNVLDSNNVRGILAKLPFGYIAAPNPPTPPTPWRPPTPLTPPLTCPVGRCYVVATATVSPQSLSQPNQMDFASLYHSGGCVPVPTCPVGKGANSTPEIIVLPVSVSGVYDKPTSAFDCAPLPDGYYECKNLKISPLTSFTAWATGPVDYPGAKPPVCDPDLLVQIVDGDKCFEESRPLPGTKKEVKPGKYWRVCLGMTTPQGKVQPKQLYGAELGWGNAMGIVLAVTRCVETTQYKGSSFNVFTPG